MGRLKNSLKSLTGRNKPIMAQSPQRGDSQQFSSTVKSKSSAVKSFGSWRGIFHRRHDSGQFSGTKSQVDSNGYDTSIQRTSDGTARDEHPTRGEVRAKTPDNTASNVVPVEDAKQASKLRFCSSNSQPHSGSRDDPASCVDLEKATADVEQGIEQTIDNTQGLTPQALGLLPREAGMYDCEDDELTDSDPQKDNVRTHFSRLYDTKITKWISDVPDQSASEDLLDSEFSDKDCELSREELRRRKFFKQLSYAAVNGRCGAAAHIRSLVDLHKCLIKNPEFDTVMASSNYSYKLSELTPADWAWIYRASLFQQYYKIFEKERLDMEELQYTFKQLLPDRNTKLLGREYFQVHVETFVHKGIFTRDDADFIIHLQAYQHEPQELRAYRAEEARKPVSTFQQLPYSNGEERTIMLRRLIDAAVYERKSWEGIYFEDAAQSFQQFYTAFQLSESDNSHLSPEATPYHRSWTPKEQRMLHHSAMLLTLLQRVKAGKIDPAIYTYIRSATAKFLVPGQPFISDMQDLRQFLETRYEDGGLAMSEIPEILIHHPEIDFLVDVGYYGSVEEARERLVEDNEVFQGVERERYVRFEEAVWELSKVVDYGGRRSKIKSGARKLVRR